MKSFCATPIRTVNGYKIGVLWLLDDEIRPELAKHQLRFIRQAFVQPHLIVGTDNKLR